MKLVYAKSGHEIDIPGVDIEFITVNSAILEVIIRGPGTFAKILRGESYNKSLEVLIPEPPKEVDRWVLAGKFIGITDVMEIFESEREAKDRLEEFQDKIGYGKETYLSIFPKKFLQMADGIYIPKE